MSNSKGTKPKPSKEAKNRRFVRYLEEQIAQWGKNRSHGEMHITFFDGEIRGLSLNKKVRNPEEERQDETTS